VPFSNPSITEGSRSWKGIVILGLYYVGRIFDEGWTLDPEII
jgi:hypothetical protein